MAADSQLIRHAGARHVNLGRFGARFLLTAQQTGGAFSLVEHEVPPRTLAAPLHRHVHEDEFSVVLEDVLSVQLGEHVFEAAAGDVIMKPRGQWHTFWNAGAETC